MPLNPDCTPGWVDAAGSGYISRCGCGWSDVAASRSEAKRLQREHRFPPLTVNDDDFYGVCWICGHGTDHDGVPHSEALGDGLTRFDIVAYLDAARSGVLFMTPSGRA